MVHPLVVTRLSAQLGVVLVTTFAACGKDRATSPSQSIAGVYSLQTVNGQALPYVSSQTSGSTTELVADELILLADDTWSELTTFRVTSGDAVNRSQGAARGTYATSSGQPRFTFVDGGSGTFDASFDGTTLTLRPTGKVLVFARGSP